MLKHLFGCSALSAILLCTAVSQLHADTTASSSSKVQIETSMGNVILLLDAVRAPITVENFLGYVDKGFYDGTIFHRVILGFMVQGGDPNTKADDSSKWGFGGPEHTVAAEFNDVHHERGILSMARGPDPNSAGSQFFIMHGEAGALDGQYTAFGKICDDDSLVVLQKIGKLPTRDAGSGEKSSPVEKIGITKLTVTDA